MFILDTDILEHLLRGHARVAERRSGAAEKVVLTIVTRIEVLQGRFASVMKAEDGQKLLLAQRRLAESESRLARFDILPFDGASEAEFDRLRKEKKLRKIGRGDLLIACIALATKATLVTRNLKDYRQVPGLLLENWAD